MCEKKISIIVGRQNEFDIKKDSQYETFKSNLNYYNDSKGLKEYLTDNYPILLINEKKHVFFVNVENSFFDSTSIYLNEFLACILYSIAKQITSLDLSQEDLEIYFFIHDTHCGEKQKTERVLENTYVKKISKFLSVFGYELKSKILITVFPHETGESFLVFNELNKNFGNGFTDFNPKDIYESVLKLNDLRELRIKICNLKSFFVKYKIQATNESMQTYCNKDEEYSLMCEFEHLNYFWESLLNENKKYLEDNDLKTSINNFFNLSDFDKIKEYFLESNGNDIINEIDTFVYE